MYIYMQKYLFIILAFFLASFLFLAVVQTASEPTVVKLQNPLGGQTAENPAGRVDLRVILGEITEKALAVMGSLALLVFVYGGFMWLTAAGSDDKVKKGSQAMVWAVIGIFIVFSSYAILTLVLKGIGAEGLPTPVSSPPATTTPGGLVSEKGCQLSGFKCVGGLGCNPLTQVKVPGLNCPNIGETCCKDN